MHIWNTRPVEYVHSLQSIFGLNTSISENMLPIRNEARTYTHTKQSMNCINQSVFVGWFALWYSDLKVSGTNLLMSIAFSFGVQLFTTCPLRGIFYYGNARNRLVFAIVGWGRSNAQGNPGTWRSIKPKRTSNSMFLVYGEGGMSLCHKI